MGNYIHKIAGEDYQHRIRERSRASTGSASGYDFSKIECWVYPTGILSGGWHSRQEVAHWFPVAYDQANLPFI